tara:strand:+ start:1163 stop:1396 length:234 start_codon:yes stop_codon:yes gene_type:complete
MNIKDITNKFKAKVNNIDADDIKDKTVTAKDKTVNYLKSLETSDYLLAACTLLLLDIEDDQDFIADVTAADYYQSHM